MASDDRFARTTDRRVYGAVLLYVLVVALMAEQRLARAVGAGRDLVIAADA